MRKILLLLTAIVSFSAYSNNLVLNNFTATSSTVSFDISWDNSWKMSNLNHDAVWIFVKYQDCNSIDKTWKHLSLSSNSATYQFTPNPSPTPNPNNIFYPAMTIETVTDKKGIFLRRTNDGGGTVLGRLTITSDDVNVSDLTLLNVEVMGIEMVYVPQGGFELGDGNGNHSFTASTVSSESSVPLNYYRGSSSSYAFYGYTSAVAVPANFPKGYASFYCMKYEISQAQYVSFLNKLDYVQQSNRVYNLPASTGVFAFGSSGTSPDNRNGISVMVAGTSSQPAEFAMDLNNNQIYNEAEDGHNIACNFLNWDDLSAYLDWVALRPMTELEFEKACRGRDSRTSSEKAWGTTTGTNYLSTSLNNTGAFNEIFTNALPVSPTEGRGAFGAGTSLGPLRVGISATIGTTRVSAGATYWGIMDMSGNVYEQTLKAIGNNTSSGSSLGSNFTANSSLNNDCGDGLLDGFGNSTMSTWGSNTSSILRGGSYRSTMITDYSCELNISHRNHTISNSVRDSRIGGRGVR